MSTAAAIARVLGGHRSANGYLCHCPLSSHGRGRGDRRPSLLVKDGTDAVLFKCFAGCDAKHILAELRCRGIVGPAAKRCDRADREAAEPPPAHRPDLRSVALWSVAQPIAEGSAPAKFLEARGITIAPPPSLRSSTIMHLDRFTLPAMFAAVQAPDRQMIAVQQTLIDPRGDRKARVRIPRRTIGALGWGAVRLNPAGSILGLAEGTFEARVEAFRQRFLPDDPDQIPFYLIADALNLVKDQADLIGCIRLQVGRAPTVVVIDTLNRSLVGSESDDKDMAAYIRAADAIRDAFGCVVIVVHHCGIDGTRPRGHTSLAGAVDAQLAVKKDTADNIIVTVERMKDGPEGQSLASNLEVMEVGLDCDGDPITSCIVLPVDDDAAPPASDRKLSPRQRLALNVLADCSLDCGEPLPAALGLPTGLRAVQINYWRDELEARDVIDREGKNPRQDFRRMKAALLTRKAIGIRDNLVWRA